MAAARRGRGIWRPLRKIHGIQTGIDALCEFIHCVVFATLIGNGDIHFKNGSLIYYDGLQRYAVGSHEQPKPANSLIYVA